MHIPNVDRIEKVADWVELYVASKRSTLSKSQLSTMLEGERGEEIEESFLNGVWAELTNRQTEYKVPPYALSSNTVRPKISWTRIPEYMGCLLFSVYGGTGGLSSSAKEFERITCEAFRSFSGFNTKIFGWPVGGNEPKDIETRALALSSAMNERFIEAPNREKKDDTLDVAAWKPFFDSRGSQLVVLIQCASGWDWEGKTRSLRLEAWKQYIHWGCPPTPGFALPNIVPPKKWIDVSRDAGLVLDRIRIYNIMVGKARINNFRRDLIVWCRHQVNQFSD